MDSTTKKPADAQYASKWLDPYYSVDRLVQILFQSAYRFSRYDKALKPRLELIVRNLNRPNDDKKVDPILLNTYR